MEKRKLAALTGAFLGAILKSLVLAAVLAAFSLAVVCPLCILAASSPRAYTIAVIAALTLALLCLIVRHVRRHGARQSVRLALRPAIAVSGFFLCARLIVGGNRPLALGALLAAAALFVIVPRILGAGAKELASETEK